MITKMLPEGYTIGRFLDINLWKQMEGNDAVKITEVPNGKVKVQITIPEDLRKEG